MGVIPLDKFNLNRFWEKTPTPLKYILIFAILLATSYFIFSKKLDDNHITELESMKQGITATYELIDNFEDFRKEQDEYNQEVLAYLYDLHDLVNELNTNTNRKLDMLLSSGSANSDEIIEKIMLLNESFDKLSEIYKEDLEEQSKKNIPFGEANFVIIDDDGYAVDNNGNRLLEDGQYVRYDKDGKRIRDLSIQVRKKDSSNKK